MKSIATFKSPDSANVNITIEVHEKYNESDHGNPITIYEVVNSRKMPAFKGYINQVESTDGKKKWMSITALSREVDSLGNYKLTPKINEDGMFVDNSGKIVSNHNDAEQFYQKNKIDGKHFYIQKGVLTIKNNKAGTNELTSQTLLSIKVYGEEEAKYIKLTSSLAKTNPDENERNKIYNELSSFKQKNGTWATMFINKGHDFLRANGHEIREKKSSQYTAEKRDFNDNIPF